jgi:hypothetical protein
VIRPVENSLTAKLVSDWEEILPADRWVKPPGIAHPSDRIIRQERCTRFNSDVHDLASIHLHNEVDNSIDRKELRVSRVGRYRMFDCHAIKWNAYYH